MMTHQEVFTKVVKHLRQQGGKAVHGIACRYRTLEGLKCAAGCLIADEHYRPEFEGKLAINSIVKEALVCSGVPVEAMSLVDRLQDVHDASSVEDWERRFQDVARKFALEVPR